MYRLPCQNNTMQKIILDTDIGGDVEDAFAASLATISSKINLVGITTVTGNTAIRGQIAKKLLKLVSKTGVPVIAGLGNPAKMGGWEGKGVLTSQDKKGEIEKLAPSFIVKTINENPNNTSIVGIGPLSNISRALKIDKNLPQKTKRLIVIGGFFRPPKINNKQIPLGFEYNFCSDIEAIERILKAGFNLTIIPGDTVFVKECQWRKEDFKILRNISRPLIKTLLTMTGIWYENMKKKVVIARLPRVFVAPWINDSLLIAYLLKPSLFHRKKLKISLQRQNSHLLLKSVQRGGYPTRIVTTSRYPEIRKLIVSEFLKLKSQE